MATSYSGSFTENRNVTGESNPLYATWDISYNDQQGGSISAASANITFNYPPLYCKRRTAYKTYGNVLAVQRLYVNNTAQGNITLKKPSDNTANTTAFTSGTTVTVWRKDGQAANITLPVSQLFTSSNKTVKSLSYNWSVIELSLNSSASSGNHTQYYSSSQIGSVGGTITLSSSLAAPSLSAGTVSISGYKDTSGRPYANHSTYTVNYSASGKYGADVSITLKIGSQYMSVSGGNSTTGSLSISPSTAGTFTPTLTATDSRGFTTSVNLSSITVVSPGKPTISSASNASSSTTNGFWKGVSTASSSVTATSGVNGATISTVKITIGSQSGSRSGNGTVTSPTLTTAGTFTPVITVTDSLGYSNSKNLSAISVQTPSISATVTATRIGIDDIPNDSGAYALLTARITRSYMMQGSTPKNYLLQPTTYINTSTTTNVVWYTSYSSSSGFSGQVNWSNYNPSATVTLYGKMTGPFDANTSYILGVVPRSTLVNGALATDTLAPTFYLLAGLRGGKGLGIGRKPPSAGLHVGISSTFEDTVTFKESPVIQKITVNSNTYADSNPKLIFQNGPGASQNISLTFTDYDSVQVPASLTLNGNQGDEYFIAPNIKATNRLYGIADGLANNFAVGSSSLNHAQSIKAWFDASKASIRRNTAIGNYSSASGNGSMYIGYFLNGYDSNPYGGFFVAHYNNPRYVGIANGTYTQHDLLSNQNYTSYVGSVRDSSNGNATTFAFSMAGMAYGDFTWLAGWNGYQLRAVNKNLFAQASHSHPYGLSIVNVTLASGVSVTANGTYYVAAASSGLTDAQFKGIVGYDLSGSNTQYCSVNTIRKSGANIEFKIANAGTAAATATLTAHCLKQS